MQFGTLFRLISVICFFFYSLYFISLLLSYTGSPLPPDLTSGFIVPALSIVTGCPCQFPRGPGTHILPSVSQDATSGPVLAGTGAHVSLTMATLFLGWDFLVLGPLPDPALHFVCKVSTSLWFPSATQEALVLGSPGHGEYGNRMGLDYEGVGTSQ